MVDNAQAFHDKFTCWNYADRGNNGQAFTDIHGNDFYFSYKTLIAFKKAGQSLVVCENIWSNTTGGHLNSISYKEERLPYTEFQLALMDAFFTQE